MALLTGNPLKTYESEMLFFNLWLGKYLGAFVGEYLHIECIHVLFFIPDGN